MFFKMYFVSMVLMIKHVYFSVSLREVSGESSSVVGWTTGISYDSAEVTFNILHYLLGEGEIPPSSNIFVAAPPSVSTEYVCGLRQPLICAYFACLSVGVLVRRVLEFVGINLDKWILISIFRANAYPGFT